MAQPLRQTGLTPGSSAARLRTQLASFGSVSSAADGAKDLMKELSSSSQTAFLVVTHDMALAQQMDRILRLEDGKLVAA